MSELNFTHSNGNKVKLTTPDTLAANKTFKLPGADGSSGQVLKTNGSGALSFTSVNTNTGGLQVLEEFGSPCDGSSFTTSNGTVTFQNVTGGQNNTFSSYTDVTGSSISYQPPSGTVQVHYYFSYYIGYLDNANGYGLSHYQNVIDGNVVSKSKHTYRANDYQGMQHIHWIYNIGGSADNSVGRVANWNSAKIMKVQMREDSTSYNITLHANNYMDGGSGTDIVVPTLYIKAIGVPS